METRKKVDLAEILYRRSYCSPLKNYLNPDGTATSRVFKLRPKDNGELSVDMASKTTPNECMFDKLRFMLFQIANLEVVKLDLMSFESPLDDGSNDAHAVILGLEIDDDIKPGLLARKSERVLVN